MARTPEGRVKDAVKRVLKERGIWFFMPVQNGMGMVGIPDFICCHAGRFLAIETKAPDNPEDATYNQEQFRVAITGSGGISITGARSATAVTELRRLVYERVGGNVLERAA